MKAVNVYRDRNRQPKHTDANVMALDVVASMCLGLVHKEPKSVPCYRCNAGKKLHGAWRGCQWYCSICVHIMGLSQ